MNTMETNILLTPEQIPPSYCRCFQSDCSKSDSCARFLAGKHLPEGWVTGPAVYPTARQGATCVCYKQTRIIHAAYGFRALFAEVKKKDDTPLRDRIKTYLGGNTTYYRYHNGERLLTPEQQEWIINLFRRHSYTDELRFDEYRDLYDFILT